MIKFFFTLLIFILSTKAICQDTKIIIEKVKEPKQISEKYYVLKSDKKIKHGLYISYFKMTEADIKKIKEGKLKLDSFIKEKGNYNIGKKDGEWIVYEYPNKLKTKGNYLNDNKIGIWTISYEDGKVIEEYDFDQKKQVSLTIKINTEYPEEDIESNVKGEVIVKYQVHQDCSISNITISKSLSDACDKAAIATTKKYGHFLRKYSKNCEEKTHEIGIQFQIDE